MTDFEENLKIIKSRENSLSKSIELINQFYNSGDFNKTNNELFNLVRISENLTERIRVLPVFTGYNQAIEEVENVIIEESGLSVTYKDDIVHLKIGSLLPRKEKETQRAGYIRTAAIVASERFYRENKFDIIREPVVVVFKHNYSEENRAWRDHDNIEVNVIMDALALYFLSDDSAKTCDHFYFSEKGDIDSTDVFIIKKTKFERWLKDNY